MGGGHVKEIGKLGGDHAMILLESHRRQPLPSLVKNERSLVFQNFDYAIVACVRIWRAFRESPERLSGRQTYLQGYKGLILQTTAVNMFKRRKSFLLVNFDSQKRLCSQTTL